jgi:SAM-dependent methyltransferase
MSEQQPATVYLSRFRLARALVRLTTVGLPKGPHLTRYFLYRRLSELALPHHREPRILSISQSTRLCGTLGLSEKNVVEADYPDCRMDDLPFPDESFDYVLSDQVLEHIESDPSRAIDESYRVLKKGGVAVHTTCFLNPVHLAPDDYWRFTPSALKLLSKQFSRIIDCGGWGNQWIGLLLVLGLRNSPVPHATWHPFHRLATMNHPNWPFITWIVAQK